MIPFMEGALAISCRDEAVESTETAPICAGWTKVDVVPHPTNKLRKIIHAAPPQRDFVVRIKHQLEKYYGRDQSNRGNRVDLGYSCMA